MINTRTLSLAGLTLVGLTLMTVPARAQDSDLISGLVNDLGVTEAQAIGGTKALIEAAKPGLSADEFSQLEALPALAGVMGDAGPVAGAIGSSEVGGAAAAAMGAVPGGDGAGDALGAVTDVATSQLEGLDLSQLSEIAGLSSSFGELGLSADMAQKFLPIVLKSLGGSGGASLLTKGLGLI